MIGRMGCYFENGKVKYWFKFASAPTRIIKMPVDVLSKCRFYDSAHAWFAGDK